jgi:hypothetical protein
MRLLCYALLVVLLAASCRDKVICPTFQSTYILDDSVRNTYFSYLWYLSEDERKSYLAANAKPSEVLPPDSLGAMVASTDKAAGVDYFAYTAEYKPPVRETKKTKFGIVKRTPIIPDLVRNIQLKTGPRQNVLTPPTPDAEEDEPAGMPQDSAAYAPLDSTAAMAQVDSLGVQRVDSAAVAKKVEKKRAPWEPFKYGFNPLDSMQPDQEYYFRKYGWLLQNAKPKEEPADSTASDSTATQKKGLKGLFKKKNKEEGEDVSEGAEQEEGATEKPPKEKKPKEKKPKATKEEEATEPEEEGDGF